MLLLLLRLRLGAAAVLAGRPECAKVAIASLLNAKLKRSFRTPAVVLWPVLAAAGRIATLRCVAQPLHECTGPGRKKIHQRIGRLVLGTITWVVTVFGLPRLGMPQGLPLAMHGLFRLHDERTRQCVCIEGGGGAWGGAACTSSEDRRRLCCCCCCFQRSTHLYIHANCTAARARAYVVPPHPASNAAFVLFEF